MESIGPSDSSDSGSDLDGVGYNTRGDVDASIDDADADDATSDRSGTGERLGLGDDSELRVGADIAPDRVVGADEAGLGGGLDQAEEAQLGVTDEELARRRSSRG